MAIGTYKLYRNLIFDTISLNGSYLKIIQIHQQDISHDLKNGLIVVNSIRHSPTSTYLHRVHSSIYNPFGLISRFLGYKNSQSL